MDLFVRLRANRIWWGINVSFGKRRGDDTRIETVRGGFLRVYRSMAFVAAVLIRDPLSGGHLGEVQLRVESCMVNAE